MYIQKLRNNIFILFHLYLNKLDKRMSGHTHIQYTLPSVHYSVQISSRFTYNVLSEPPAFHHPVEVTLLYML